MSRFKSIFFEHLHQFNVILLKCSRTLICIIRLVATSSFLLLSSTEHKCSAKCNSSAVSLRVYDFELVNFIYVSKSYQSVSKALLFLFLGFEIDIFAPCLQECLLFMIKFHRFELKFSIDILQGKVVLEVLQGKLQ